jgi:hypothetical protein
MTEEHKRKIQEGRKKAMEERKLSGLPLRESKKSKKTKALYKNDKPVLVYDGTEKTGFDFWPKLRNLLRPIHKYDLCKQIEKEIVSPQIWQNVGIILNLLSNHVTLELADTTNKKVKKERKKREYKMTPEHKEKLMSALKKAREVKKNESISR